MESIEQWFGISPDGGSGSTEFASLGVAVLSIVGLATALRRYFEIRLTLRVDPATKNDRDTHPHS